MAPSHLDDGDFESVVVDSAQPLKGIIVCCTSIPPDQRTSIASKVSELGGLHKYDLTPDVTHLIVGDYDTPKYRHVARERPDIKAMDAAWIEALSELWKNDDEIDFATLESEHQLKALEKRGADPSATSQESAKRDSLLICLTGFGDQRDEISRKITTNGGLYTGDLTRRCTHLIVNKPEGKKFAAAKAWGIYAVTLDWLDQSIARGMILEEAKFDPVLPAEEQGKGAWVKKDATRAVWGKRSRSLMAGGNEDGPRKLRKTASMKLNSQRNNLWGDILGRSTTVKEYSFAGEPEQQAEPEVEPQPEPTIPAVLEQQGVFAYCYFFIHGFSPERTSVLEQTIATLGGNICSFLYEAALGPYPQPGEPKGRFLLVPQSSQPDTHPPANYDNLYIVTEYYIEKCMHNKAFFDPNQHVLGRPFPLFPIPGFSDLTICKAAFTGIELNQVARSVTQLGACFKEEFRRETSVLVCKSLAATRKEKLRMALKWGIPVVSAEWLWECISTGFKAPIDDFVFPELKSHYEAAKQQKEPHEQRSSPSDKSLPNVQPRQAAKALHRTRSEPALGKATSKPLPNGGIDTTAFDHESPDKPKLKPKPQPHVNKSIESFDTHISAEFTTALTHPAPKSFSPQPDAGESTEVPLSEVSSNRLNKSPSPAKNTTTTTVARTHSEPLKPIISNQPSVPLAQDTDDDLKRRQQQQQQQQAAEEEARNKAKAAERQALSSKLTSLIAPIASATSDDSPHDPSNPAHPPAAGSARPRRRQILGRAISNASNASSDAARSDILLRDFSEQQQQQQEKEDVPPPATQLEYVDPKAEECKAALMSRMMGGVGPDVKRKSVQSSSTATGRTMRRR
ncbi:BRCT domain-containing protein [Mariannaea sp. PMI_226]|nr:BRCT domain-containing protein [Mariannaea sp. PMI_226]